jgi:hypothetical protein
VDGRNGIHQFMWIWITKNEANVFDIKSGYSNTDRLFGTCSIPVDVLAPEGLACTIGKDQNVYPAGIAGRCIEVFI